MTHKDKEPMAHDNQSRINEAARFINNGGLVAMPTETVYGLAADATEDASVARIFEAKGRPTFNPLIVHVANLAMAAQYAEISPLAKKLADAFWPGALTLVLPRRADCNLSLLVSAGLDTIALRAPNHPVAQALIAKAGRPLAAPSANRSGGISSTEANHVRQSLGSAVDMILDDGPCSVGVESTIVKIDDDTATLLRPGGVARQDIEALIGAPLSAAPHSDKPEAPGMLTSHYAPAALLRLNASTPKENEAFLGFGAAAVEAPFALNLSAKGDLREAAANLFAHLRKLDDICSKHGLSGIAAASIPTDGLGEAINDRLTRAAAPKS